MADPSQGDTVATTGAAPDAVGVTAEAERGVKAMEGVGDTPGVDAVTTAVGFETVDGVRGADGLEAMSDLEGVEVIEGAGAVLPELATADFPGIGPAHETASQQKQIANNVATIDLDMCFPFDLLAGSIFLLVKPPQFHKKFFFPRQTRMDGSRDVRTDF